MEKLLLAVIGFFGLALVLPVIVLLHGGTEPSPTHQHLIAAYSRLFWRAPDVFTGFSRDEPPRLKVQQQSPKRIPPTR